MNSLEKCPQPLDRLLPPLNPNWRHPNHENNVTCWIWTPTKIVLCLDSRLIRLSFLFLISLVGLNDPIRRQRYEKNHSFVTPPSRQKSPFQPPVPGLAYCQRLSEEAASIVLWRHPHDSTKRSNHRPKVALLFCDLAKSKVRITISREYYPPK